MPLGGETIKPAQILAGYLKFTMAGLDPATQPPRVRAANELDERLA